MFYDHELLQPYKWCVMFSVERNSYPDLMLSCETFLESFGSSDVSRRSLVFLKRNTDSEIVKVLAH